MEIRLRQRLIGAAVLLGLAGIFLPWLIKGLHSTHSAKKTMAPTANIPASPSIPNIKETVIVLPNNQTITLKNTVNNNMVAQPVNRTIAITPGLHPVEFKPITTSTAVGATNAATVIEPGKAWTIELGTFANDEHAQSLLKQLQSKGFTAYLRSDQNASNKNLTVVFVGPEVKQAQAQQLLQRLDSELHMKGVIVAFHPTG